MKLSASESCLFYRYYFKSLVVGLQNVFCMFLRVVVKNDLFYMGLLLSNTSQASASSLFIVFVTIFRSKKVSVPLNAISRVIGRGGSNINAIRTATGAQIEVEKQCKGQGERIITIK